MESSDVRRPRERGFVAHATACVDEPAEIGAGTRIDPFCHVMQGAVIGRSCSLGQNVFISTDTRIGDHVRIANNVSIFEGVVLEDHVICGPSMVFTDAFTERADPDARAPETRVCRGASIGANATIVRGRTIGSFAIVGAGSVVTKDVPAFSAVYGNPARVGGYVCECGSRLRFDARGEALCERCGEAYGKRGHTITKLGRPRSA